MDDTAEWRYQCLRGSPSLESNLRNPSSAAGPPATLKGVKTKTSKSGCAMRMRIRGRLVSVKQDEYWARFLSRAPNAALFVAIRTVDQLRVIVENHGGNLLRAERSPVRQLRMIGISRTGKMNPRIAYQLCKR